MSARRIQQYSNAARVKNGNRSVAIQRRTDGGYMLQFKRMLEPGEDASVRSPLEMVLRGKVLVTTIALSEVSIEDLSTLLATIWQDPLIPTP